MLSRLLGLKSDSLREVWFSRDVQRGQLQSWTIFTKSYRFKLKLRGDGLYDCTDDLLVGWSATYENQRVQEKGRDKVYENDRYCLSRVCYTRLRKQEVFETFHAVRAGFPPQLVFSQCQDLLRQFVTRIYAQEDPNNWSWFLENTDLNRRTIAESAPGPAHIMEALRKQQGQQSNQNNQYMGHMNNLQMGVALQNQQQQNMMQQQQIQNNQYMGGYGS